VDNNRKQQAESIKNPKVAVISANLGGFDNLIPHSAQSVEYDYFLYTDENFHPRYKVMTSRLQSRLPRCFGWQMVPDYDYYLWIDGNLRLKHPDSLKYFLDNISGYDVVALRHIYRPNIRQETRYIRKGVRQQSIYLVNRYDNELLDELYTLIQNDKDYIDDMLLHSGIFMYRNTAKVQAALKELWYYITRYHICDQLTFVYALRKAGLKINARPDKCNDCWFLELNRHRYLRSR